jgi:heme oxygenase
MNKEDFFYNLVKYWHIIVTYSLGKSTKPTKSIRKLLGGVTTSATIIASYLNKKGFSITGKEAVNFVKELLDDGILVRKGLVIGLSKEEIKKAVKLHGVESEDRLIDWKTELDPPMMMLTEFLAFIIHNWDRITITYVYKKRIDAKTIVSLGVRIKEDIYRVLHEDHPNVRFIDVVRLMEYLLETNDILKKQNKYYFNLENREKALQCFSQLEITSNTYDIKKNREDVDFTLKEIYKITNRLHLAEKSELFVILEWITKMSVDPNANLDVGIIESAIKQIRKTSRKVITPEKLVEIAKHEGKKGVMKVIKKLNDGIKKSEFDDVPLPEEPYDQEVEIPNIDDKLEKFEGKNVFIDQFPPKYVIDNESLYKFYGKMEKSHRLTFLECAHYLEKFTEAIPWITENIKKLILVNLHFLQKDTNKLKGRSAKIMASAILHFQLKDAQMLSSVRTISSVASIKSKQMMNCYKEFLNAIDVKNKNQNLEDISEWVFVQFNVNDEFKRKYRKIVNFLNVRAEQTNESVGGEYVNGMVGAVIYVCYLRIGKHVIQDFIAEKCLITTVTLRTYYYQIEKKIKNNIDLYNTMEEEHFD